MARRAFEGMQVAPRSGATVITGRVRDQSELHSLLRRVGDLGLTLVSATAVEPRSVTPVPPEGGGESRPAARVLR